MPASRGDAPSRNWLNLNGSARPRLGQGATDQLRNAGATPARRSMFHFRPGLPADPPAVKFLNEIKQLGGVRHRQVRLARGVLIEPLERMCGMRQMTIVVLAVAALVGPLSTSVSGSSSTRYVLTRPTANGVGIGRQWMLMPDAQCR